MKVDIRTFTSFSDRCKLRGEKNGNLLKIYGKRAVEELARSHEAILAILPESKEEAISIRDIAQAMKLEISGHVNWVRAERRLVRSLGALIRWGWIACDERQKEEGHKFCY